MMMVRVCTCKSIFIPERGYQCGVVQGLHGAEQREHSRDYIVCRISAVLEGGLQELPE